MNLVGESKLTVDWYEPRLSRLTDWLTVGGDLPTNVRGDYAQVQVGKWVEMGITALIDTRLEYHDIKFVAEHAPQITYKHLPVDDDGGILPSFFWKRGLAFAEDQLSENPDGGLYVHCHMGVNRSPSLAYAIMVEHLGFDYIEAYKTIREKRPDAYAIYAPQYLVWASRNADARDLDKYMMEDHTEEDQIKTIGRIRREVG